MLFHAVLAFMLSTGSSSQESLIGSKSKLGYEPAVPPRPVNYRPNLDQNRSVQSAGTVTSATAEVSAYLPSDSSDTEDDATEDGSLGTKALLYRHTCVLTLRHQHHRSSDLRKHSIAAVSGVIVASHERYTKYICLPAWIGFKSSDMCEVI